MDTSLLARSNSDVEELPIVDDPHEQCLDVTNNKIITIAKEIDEDEEKTDDIVAGRIKWYIDTANFTRSVVGATLKNLKKTTSFLNKCGVRLLNEDGVEFFVCLLDPYFHPKKPVVIKCTKTTCSNATAYLDKKHKITSNKTLAAKRKVTLLQKQLSMSDPAFKRDPTRWFHVQLDAWSAEQLLSYNTFDNQRWRLIACQLPVGPGSLKSVNIRKSHVEHYVTCKNIIVKSIAEACKSFSIPFMAIFLDIIKSKTSNQKYLAMRICFNSPTCFNVGYNLAVRCFAPSTKERISDQLSHVLKEWASVVLEEFDINPSKYFLASTSDSGSDVKRTLSTLLSMCKEQECRRQGVYHKIKKIIEAVNKSEYLQSALEEACLQLFEQYLKLLNAPQHRWSSTALVLERMLICWDAILQAYREVNRHVPLSDNDRTVCIEFYSLIHPVRQIHYKVQAMQTFVAVM
ncbi:hypothetical protein MPTK1_3g25400 [Marchantia polymorpha subsp. ruderalis]|uniref:Uncharacterized protein n=2 Tax=Marchantia polymorpha TaxID=3197 RepID=A0A176WED5_MARPO|nr:hypothetical protein AXG93_1962s1410 [Marchantia polymorpha subsp. ruderalis]PTQ32347.1 hypothetical protein MARPO_0100s0053 [Marchantia polymorpha]BBN06969.1 hypothetical protein Mp_3g25400 [Marchantia polymorpha subsp. ruderalis]|eukprot:PTQ32347.1 hypothetical protein MARPO_0100s0053 [Marchantia polymorpha]